MIALQHLLRVVETKDVELEQQDIKTTFLHGNLEEDIYMSQPAALSVIGEEITSYVN